MHQKAECWEWAVVRNLFSAQDADISLIGDSSMLAKLVW
jgi:hypothetical protein